MLLKFEEKGLNQRLYFETPVIESRQMSTLAKQKVLLKMECYQPIGSFKIRGVGLLCQHLAAEGARELFSSSGGNAGYAVAYAGKKLGIPVTIVVPRTTSNEVCKILQSEGAEIVRRGEAWDDAHEKALELSEKRGGGYVHPFDHPTIWSGHATLIDECVRQSQKPDAIVVAVGGGGLFCGIMEGLNRNPDWQDVRVVTVETDGAASLAMSLQSGHWGELASIKSIAGTLGAKRVAQKAFELGKTERVTSLTVSDKQAVKACVDFAKGHRVLVEPACGAALSAVYDNLDPMRSAETVLVIVCGGIGVDPAKLAEWQQLFNL